MAAAGLFKSTDGGDSWASAGLTGTSISVLVINPITPSNLYAGGDKLFKTTDAGASWTALSVGPLDGAGSLTLDPLTPSTLYAVTFSAPASDVLYKSTDAGQSWSLVSSGVVRLLAIAPTTPSTLYAILNANTGSSGFSKSTDGGSTWTHIGLITQCIGVDPMTLAFDPTNPNTMYVASGTNPCNQMPPAIFKTTDGGQSWNALDTIHSAAASVVFSPGSTTIYAATGSGVFKSTDGGSTWGGTNTGLRLFDIKVLASDPINPETLYAGGNEGLFKSGDGGAMWAPIGTFAVAFLLIDFTNSNVLYADTGPRGCLVKSTDGGSTWSDLALCGYGGTVVMDPADPNTLYDVMGDDYDGFSILKIMDGGATWKNFAFVLGQASWVNALLIDRNTPTTLYAATDLGVLRSTDGGASFLPTALANTPVAFLTIDPLRPNVFYAATSNNPYPIDYNPPGLVGMYKSTDSGATWSAINKGLDEIIIARATVNALLVDAGRPNILYLATSGYGVFKSADGGANWAAFNDGLTFLDVRSLAVAQGSSSTVYAGTPAGVFKIVEQRMPSTPIRHRGHSAKE